MRWRLFPSVAPKRTGFRRNLLRMGSAQVKNINCDGCGGPTITFHKVFWIHYLFSLMCLNHLSKPLPEQITRCWLMDPQTHHLVILRKLETSATKLWKLQKNLTQTKVFISLYRPNPNRYCSDKHTNPGLGTGTQCRCCLLLQYLTHANSFVIGPAVIKHTHLMQSCARGGRRIVEDMC